MSSIADRFRNFRAVTLRIQRILTPANEHLFPEAKGSSALLDSLEQHGFLAEAVSLMSFALPEREAVWWACMCVTHTAPASIPPDQRRPLTAAQDWVRKPDPQTRSLALSAFKAVHPVTASAIVAKAAHAAQLANPSSMNAGRRVEIAVRRAAGGEDPERVARHLRRFLASGRDIAAGGAGRLPPACMA